MIVRFFFTIVIATFFHGVLPVHAEYIGHYQKKYHVHPVNPV